MKLLFRLFKRLLQLVLLILVLICIGLYATGNQYVFKGVQETYLKGHSTANIDDHTAFDNHVIATGNNKTRWKKHPQYKKFQLPDSLRTELERYNSAAFVVIQGNQLLYEEYWLGYDENSQTNSFSMAKSFTTMLLGAAIQDGFIGGLQDPITQYLPEYADDELAQECTLGDLAGMTAGYDWKEDYYFPINPTAKAYYTTALEKHILKRPFVRPSGERFKYLSGVTQLLGIIIQRATKKSLASYFSEKFWQPMGMENDALWATDRNDGVEKAYCCVYSNAKDFAKIGQLMLNKGEWNGKQLLDAAFVEKMMTPNYSAFAEGEPAKYGLSLWTDYDHKPAFAGFLGHLGQRILVVPEWDAVIVRLGRNKDQRKLDKGPLPGTDIYYYMEGVAEILTKMGPPEEPVGE